LSNGSINLCSRKRSKEDITHPSGWGNMAGSSNVYPT
jgi:hypothetical protein